MKNKRVTRYNYQNVPYLLVVSRAGSWNVFVQELASVFSIFCRRTPTVPHLTSEVTVASTDTSLRMVRVHVAFLSFSAT